MQGVPAVAQYCRLFRTESVFLYISNETVCQGVFYTCAERKTQQETGGFGWLLSSGGCLAFDKSLYRAARGSSLERAL